MKAISNTLHIG